MTYVMSDIHGAWDLYDRMLRRISFSDEDRLYILGDAVDRGPDGVRILDHAMRHRNVVLVRGNHEQMLVDGMDPFARADALEIWRNNGSRPTVEALTKLPLPARIRLVAYVRRSKDHADVEAGGKKFHLVHGCPGDDRRTRLWENPNPYGFPKFPDRTVVVGHTPVLYFHPSQTGYLTKCGSHMSIFRCDAFIGIDCGCGLPWNYPKRALACLRLDDMAEFYEPMRT